MAGGLSTFASAFAPRPITYRTIDFRTNEFRGLRGGERFEPREVNPMIGYRGALRYTQDPDVFALELAAVGRVWEEGRRNLHVMLPFVRTTQELRRCHELIGSSGLLERRGFELWVMAEVPSVLFNLADYAALGVAGISIGSNDLTQLLLGADRDSELLAQTFDERDPAVVAYLRELIPRARAGASHLYLRTGAFGAPRVRRAASARRHRLRIGEHGRRCSHARVDRGGRATCPAGRRARVMFAVRIHGRGGQGVVTAAELLSLAAFTEGLEAQAFPSFGSERMGAPVVAFCRIDSEPIRLREPIAEPDALVIQDPTLLHHVEVFGGLGEEGYVLINSTRSIEQLGLAELTERHRPQRLASVPASELAHRRLGRPIPNAPLLGALAAQTGIVSLAALTAAINDRFAGATAQGNAVAAADGFRHIAELAHA